jgi:hypothetical protein
MSPTRQACNPFEIIATTEQIDLSAGNPIAADTYNLIGF